jgi:hypothetical protein
MALLVPLSRFTSRVGGGSAFFVRPQAFLDFTLLVWLAKIRAVSFLMSKVSAVCLSSARAGSHGGQVRSRRIGERWDLPDFIEL